jgi:hypothetical protein
VATLARPLLQLDPDAVWTANFNQLVEHGPAAIKYLMQRPALTRPAAPGDLDVLVHTSLVRLLANPDTAPRLSTSCFETTLGLLHFDVKIDGQPLGREVIDRRPPPWSWTDLYPADFRHDLAAGVDLEGDRQRLQVWWRKHRPDPDIATQRKLRPPEDHLWRLLARHYADGWLYDPDARIVRCAAGPPRQAVLLQTTTFEYNLVRAACIWLGSRGAGAIQSRLIELVGSPLPLVAYNARFALRYSPDPRVRAIIDRYEAAAARALNTD